tara:strand:- start:131 stop:1297 length:1167 start_codon:yes stop_codon:yes gene_type:complete
VNKTNFIILSISIAFSAVIIEIFSRILISTNQLQSNYIIEYLQQKTISKNPALSNNPNQKQVSNPYILYRNNPNYINDENPKKKDYDSNGYRNPQYSPNSKCFKILALGGSTTNEDPYVTRNQSWTIQLNKLLNGNSEKGKCYEVYNAGLSWGTSAELLTEFLFKGLYLNPKLVIIHTGGNDGIALWQEEYTTDYSHIRSKGNINNGFMHFLINNKVGINLHKLSQISSFTRLMLFFWIYLEGGVSTYTPVINGMFPLSPEESLKLVKEREPISFKNNILNITTIAKSRGTKVLLVPFIQAPRDQLTSLISQAPDWKGQEETLIESVKKHRNVLKSISNRESVNFFEFDITSFQNDWFIDNCHLNDQGAREKAKQLFDYISKSNLIKK